MSLTSTKMAILTLLLVVAPSEDAKAEWAVIYRDATSNLYFDRTTVPKTANAVEVWILHSPVDSLSDSRSIMTHDASECSEEQRRLRQFFWHSGHIGVPQVIRLELVPADNWPRFNRQIPRKHLWKSGCKPS